MNDPNTLNIKFYDPLLLDRLVELSKEYSVSIDQLVIVAVKKLIYDVDLVRDIRTTGKS